MFKIGVSADPWTGDIMTDWTVAVVGPNVQNWCFC